MAGVDYGNLLKGFHCRWSDLQPVLAAVGGEMDTAVVGAGPDAVVVNRRNGDRVNHAALDRLGRGLVAEDTDRRRQVEIFARQVGRDLLPGLSAIARAP